MISIKFSFFRLYSCADVTFIVPVRVRELLRLLLSGPLRGSGRGAVLLAGVRIGLVLLRHAHLLDVSFGW